MLNVLLPFVWSVEALWTFPQLAIMFFFLEEFIGHGCVQITYRRKDDNRRLRVEIAIRAIASELTIA